MSDKYTIKPEDLIDDEPVDTSNIYQYYPEYTSHPLVPEYKVPVPATDRLIGEPLGLKWPYAYSGGKGEVEEGPSFLESTAEGLSAVKEAIVSGAQTAVEIGADVGEMVVTAAEETGGYIKDNPIESIMFAGSFFPVGRGIQIASNIPKYGKHIITGLKAFDKGRKAIPYSKTIRSGTGVAAIQTLDLVQDLRSKYINWDPEKSIYDNLTITNEEIENSLIDEFYNFEIDSGHKTSPMYLEITQDLFKYAKDKYGISIPYIKKWDDSNPLYKGVPMYSSGYLFTPSTINVTTDHGQPYITQVLTEYLHHIKAEKRGVFSEFASMYNIASGMATVAYITNYMKKNPDSEKFNARLDSEGKLKERYKLNTDGTFKLDNNGNRIYSGQWYTHSTSIRSEEMVHNLYEDKLVNIANIVDKDERENAFDEFMNEITQVAPEEAGIEAGQFIPLSSKKMLEDLEKNIMKSIYENITQNYILEDNIEDLNKFSPK